MTADRIEQEITISAPIEKVWAVLTEPEHVGQWFGQGKPAESELRPGGIMSVDHGEFGIFPTRIVRVEPPHFFSFRWASAYPGEVATDENSTLVEFTLTADGGNTRLRLVESGFGNVVIPPDKVTTAGYDSHSGGWPEILNALRVHTEKLPT